MNPADVAQSALPLTSSDLSLFTLFWQAHWIVKIVMIGLLVASIWVWAIVVDKTILFARTRKAMDGFENAFWSGQSLEELYRSLSAGPAYSMGAVFVAAMREWKRSFEGHAKSFAGLQTRVEKVMSVSIAREIDRLEKRLLVLATVGFGGPLHRPVRHGVGHYDELSVDRRVEEYLARGRCARHCRGLVRDRNRPRGGHTGDHFL